MSVRLSALRAGRPLTSGRFLVLTSVRGWIDPRVIRVIVLLEGLDLLKNPVTSSGTRTRELSACSIVAQPTTVPRVPSLVRFFLVSWGKVRQLQYTENTACISSSTDVWRHRARLCCGRSIATAVRVMYRDTFSIVACGHYVATADVYRVTS
jgi:hypothetical protein